jgi:septal ring factor EnvC (AmiA/AmiB activator)
MARAIELVYACCLALSLALFALCWSAVDSQPTASKAQSRQDIETVQQLKDRVQEHENRITADEVGQQKLGDEVAQLREAIGELRIRLDGISTMGWGIVVPIILIAIKEMATFVNRVINK